MKRSWLLVAAAVPVIGGCVTTDPPPMAMCPQSSLSPVLKLEVLGGEGIVLVTSTTTNTSSASNYTDAAVISKQLDGALADPPYVGTGSGSSSSDASVTSTPIPVPTPVAVTLQLAADFVCPVEGDVHATMTTSVGQFTSGVAASAAGGGGAGDSGVAASGGSSGVAGASTTVLLGVTNMDDAGPVEDAGTTADATLPFEVVSQAPDASAPSNLYGYATLQLTTDRASFLQVVIGDTTICAELVVNSTPNTTPNAPVTAALYPCDGRTHSPGVDPPVATDAGIDATLQGGDASVDGGVNDSGSTDGGADSSTDDGGTIDASLDAGVGSEDAGAD